MDVSDCFLGVDLGSSSVKVAAFSPDGTLLGEARRTYPTAEPQPGYKEQDPESWWRATVSAVHEVLGNGIQVKALAVAGHISSLTFVDTSGRPLRPALGFQDRRAVAELGRLHSLIDRETLADHLGLDLPPAATWPLPRLLWFQRHEPQILDHARFVLQAKDVLNHRLTGEFASDGSSSRGLVDVDQDRPASDVFSLLDLPPDLLPPIRRPDQTLGPLSSTAARETGLPEGIPVMVGWNDLNASVLGSGAVQVGNGFNVTGTSEHIGVVTSATRTRRELLCAPYLPGKRLLYGVTLSGGGAFDWYCRSVGRSREELLESAEGVPAGSESLFFLPYLEGERSPIWDLQAAGAFIGIRTSHGLGHFARAVLEGVAYGLRQILDLVVDSSLLEGPIRIVGGASRLRLWNQIRADVLGRNVVVPVNADTGVLGAAMLAAMGSGSYTSFEDAARGMARLGERTSARVEDSARYLEAYAQFCRIYPALRDVFAQIAVSQRERSAELA